MNPPYKHLLTDIGKLEDGVKFLVNMRKDLLVSSIYAECYENVYQFC